MNNALDQIEKFIRYLKLKPQTKKVKLNHLMKLYDYMNLSLNDKENWDFKSVEPYVLMEKVFYRPINKTIVKNFFSDLTCKVSDKEYNWNLSTIKQFFRFLVWEGILTENPADIIEHKKVKIKDMTNSRITFTEAIALLKAAYLYCEEHRNRNFTLALTLLTTTLRVGELRSLSEEDIDFGKMILWGYGKTGSRRRIMTPGLKNSLEPLLHDPIRLKSIDGARYVFYSDKGGQMKTDEVNSLLKTFAQKAGINKDISSYYLRRTFANLLVENNFSLIDIQNIFDHDRIRSTLFYVKLSKQKEADTLLANSTMAKMVGSLIKQEIKLLKGNKT